MEPVAPRDAERPERGGCVEGAGRTDGAHSAQQRHQAGKADAAAGMGCAGDVGGA
jgi:hypothetical protein